MSLYKEKKMNLSGKKEVFHVICISFSIVLVLGSGVCGTMMPAEKPLGAAILSVDYFAGLLGLGYGVDPTEPTLTAMGSCNASGFTWSVEGIYQGNTGAWACTGIYDNGTSSISWNGSGVYKGENWDMSGKFEWLSETDFRVQHQIWIGETPQEHGIGTDGWDVGGFQHGSMAGYKIEWSRSWLWWATGGILGKAMVDSVTIIYDDGTQQIVENNLSYTDPITVNGDGTITVSGGSFEKNLKITPEPATALLLGLGGLTLFRRRRK
jgi:hypothetical protein